MVQLWLYRGCGYSIVQLVVHARIIQTDYEEVCLDNECVSRPKHGHSMVKPDGPYPFSVGAARATLISSTCGPG